MSPGSWVGMARSATAHRAGAMPTGRGLASGESRRGTAGESDRQSEGRPGGPGVPLRAVEAAAVETAEAGAALEVDRAREPARRRHTD